MQLLILVFVLCNVLQVIAGGERAAMEMIILYKFRQVEVAANVPTDKRIIAPECDDCNLAKFIKLATGKKKGPNLKSSGDYSNRMALALELVRQGYGVDYKARTVKVGNSNEQSFDHIVKGSKGYTTFFQIVGARAAELKRTSTEKAVTDLLDDFTNGLSEAYHLRRSDAHKVVLKDLKISHSKWIYTIKERPEHGDPYDRWDKEKAITMNPADKDAIELWVKTESSQRRTRRHQAAITPIVKAHKALGRACSELELPERHRLHGRNTTLDVHD